MSEDTQNGAFTVTAVLPTIVPAAELKTLSAASDSSSTDENNVSFINITYTIQPHSFISLFKKFPPKKILDDVRYIKLYS